MVYGDDFHLTSTLVKSFPFEYAKSGMSRIYKELIFEVNNLMEDYKEKSKLKRANYPTGAITYQEFYPRESHQIILRIDDLIGSLYGLSNEELEYLKNYDIGFRTDDS